jgi:ribosome biogenesis GTPase
VETPVVGDWVAVDGDDLVAALLPRRSLLRRRDAIADAEQAMAANVDLLVIVCGLDRPMRDGRVQRAVALAWDAGATPLVVLTKADLVPDPVHVGETVDAVRSAVHEVDVLVVSASDGTGMADLLAVVSGQTVVLLGESGAGKSTLVNALVGEDVAATGAVRAGDAKGRHTTTTRQLHPLPGGGVLLDSPGIRAIGLWVDPEAVDAVFPELEVLASDCRFADCAHDGEPGCAVSAAVADGRLDDERLATWRAMRGEATAAARTDQERRRHERKFGKVAKQAQARKGRRQP